MATEKRRLAAVMFADIEGYTRKFQQNEDEALQQIETHRSDLYSIIQNHKGRINQFYGDGSVSVFDSVKDAVRCAEELQKTSIQHGIPLRIGIHIGDLIFKGEEMYGDVVNITSRIQNEGIAGSVLVSKKVADEFKNTPETKFKYLGDYSLKNVAEPMPVYALEGNGLEIPPVRISLVPKHETGWKKYRFYFLIPLAIGFVWLMTHLSSNKLNQNERIAIPPFEDRTGDARFNVIGMMASDWITNQLAEATTAKVMSYESGMLFTNGKPGIFRSSPSFARKAGCRYMLDGSYTLTGQNKDSLLFLFTIHDCKTNKPLDVKLRPVICSSQTPLEGIKEVTNVVKGFWKSKKSGLLSPPLFDAYAYYIKAIQDWNGDDPVAIDTNLRKAIELDPKFLDAYMRLFEHKYNYSEFDTARTILQSIRDNFQDLSQKSELALTFYAADMSGKRKDAWNILQEFLKEDETDFFTNTTAMVMACEYLNDPDKAITNFPKIDVTKFDLSTCHYCKTRLLYAIRAYNELGLPTEAGKLASIVYKFANQSTDYITLLDHYARLNDPDMIRSLIMQIKQDPDQQSLLPYASYVAARSAFLYKIKDKEALLKELKQNVIDQESRLYARFLLLENDWQKAKTSYEALISKDRFDLRTWGELGIATASLGDAKSSEDVIDSIRIKSWDYDFGESDYMVGRIYAILKNQSKAMESLNLSLQNGRLFETAVTFMYDPNMQSISSDQEYQQLLISRR